MPEWVYWILIGVGWWMAQTYPTRNCWPAKLWVLFVDTLGVALVGYACYSLGQGSR